MRVSRILLALTVTPTLLGGNLLAGCRASSEGEAEQAAAEAAEVQRQRTWPLTGTSVPDGGSPAKKRPVLVVKMDNTEASAPQVGLSGADLVVEELVEGGYTRLAAFFYESLPDVVGPVRSMRASDIGIVSPVEADIVTSGAAAETIQRITAAGITFYNEKSPGFFRDSDRTSPYDLFAELPETARESEDSAARPPDYLTWGRAADLPRGEPAGAVSVRFSDSHTTSWRSTPEGYLIEGGNAAADDQFAADTVLVLRVDVTDAGYLDPAGNTVPETVLAGAGPATLIHDGRAVAARWSKDELDGPLELRTAGASGRPLAVPAGHVWIELVPRKGGSVTTTP